MDQERDTPGHRPSSPSNAPERQNIASSESHRRYHGANAPEDEPALKGFQGFSGDVANPSRTGSPDRHHQHQTRQRPVGEAPPILFQLPNRSSGSNQIDSDSPQFAIHRGHSGPPASHVDSSPGDQHQTDRSGPHHPIDSNSAVPISQPAVDRESKPSTQTPIDQSADYDQRLAAYRDAPTMSWAQDSSVSWATRAVVVILVLFMVTLSFFAGRGLHRSGFDSADSVAQNQNTANGEIVVDDLGETVIVITEDDAPTATESNLTETLSTDTSLANASAEAFKNAGVDEASVAELSTRDLSNDAPSYIVEADGSDLVEQDTINPMQSEIIANAANELARELANTDNHTAAKTELTFSEPVLPESTVSEPADGTLGLEITAPGINEPGIGEPGIGDVTDSMVSYRTESDSEPTPVEDQASREYADDLPAGMADKLDLNDGLRYTATPFPIGNFLEILRAWETSSLEY